MLHAVEDLVLSEPLRPIGSHGALQIACVPVVNDQPFMQAFIMIPVLEACKGLVFRRSAGITEHGQKRYLLSNWTFSKSLRVVACIHLNVHPLPGDLTAQLSRGLRVRNTIFHCVLREAMVLNAESQMAAAGEWHDPLGPKHSFPLVTQPYSAIVCCRHQHPRLLRSRGRPLESMNSCLLRCCKPSRPLQMQMALRQILPQLTGRPLQMARRRGL